MSGRPRGDLDLTADRNRALQLIPVSRETAARLDRVVALLRQWQRTTNLIAPSTVPKIWTRHIADSLQLLALAPQARHWIDLGSGGGFPGLAIACALADQPGARVDLVESNGKKCAFLRAAAQASGAPAEVHCQRIESFVEKFDGHPDIVTARALAPLATLCGYVAPLLKRGAQALLPKGQDVEAELTQATRYWNIAADLVRSETDPDARIVVIRALERKSVR
jgi:16S rRNA (guanine527-N7)-methyltransferase